MKTAHTSGPWNVGENIHTRLMTDVCARDGEDWLADAGPLNGLDPGECVANAALMASAPDLLAALEECRHALDIALCGTPSPAYFKAVKTALKIAKATSIEDNLALNCQEIKDAAQVALDKARAAIARATGGEK